MGSKNESGIMGWAREPWLWGAAPSAPEGRRDGARPSREIGWVHAELHIVERIGLEGVGSERGSV